MLLLLVMVAGSNHAFDVGALFTHQFEHCAPYRRFCEGRGRTPDSVTHPDQIPPVPTGAFKELALRCFPEERIVHTFRTSGTSLPASRKREPSTTSWVPEATGSTRRSISSLAC